jgi:DNA-binding transcriptional LysR family regulator
MSQPLSRLLIERLPGHLMAARGALNLHEITVFIAVTQSNSFSQAAQRLHLSQPAVSQAIHCLETQFGTRLFERRRHAIRLTQAGETLLPVARDLAGASRNVVDTMNRVDSVVAGELVVGCSTTTGKYALPGLVAAFRHQFPEVRVRLDMRSKDEVLARLLDGQLTLGVTSQVSDQPGLEFRPFFEDRVILVVPAGHPWADYGRALPADLTDQPMIMREAGLGTTTVLLEGLAQHGLTGDMLDVVMQVSNAEAIELAVEEGIGVAFISELAAQHGLALGRIKRVEVEGLELRRVLYMARDINWPLTRVQERFWVFVSERAPKPRGREPKPEPGDVATGSG